MQVPRVRFTLRRMMLVVAVSAVAAALAFTMVRSYHQVVLVRGVSPGHPYEEYERNIEIPLLPLIFAVVGAGFVLRRSARRASPLAAFGLALATGLAIGGFIILVHFALRRFG